MVIRDSLFGDKRDYHETRNSEGKITSKGAALNGYRLLLHENGVVQSEGIVFDGVPVGLWHIYDKQGGLVRSFNATENLYNEHNSPLGNE